MSVVICQYCRPCLSLSTNDCAVGKQWCKHSWKRVWNDCCAPLRLVFVFQESWGWEEGSKIWQIAENCLQTVIPVWTHSAHLVVIWQQKCRGGGLSSESGATYYPIPPLLFHFISSGLVCKHTEVHPTPLCGVLGADGVCSDAWQLSHRGIPEFLSEGLGGS